MSFGLSGRIALVTGASRGIGAAIADTLSRAGAFVVGTATTLQGADRISESLESQGLSGKGLVLDLNQPEMIESLLLEMQKSCGLPNILVNNAAITQDNLMLRMKDEEWERVIHTNLTSVYRMTKANLKHMLKDRYGRIVNLTSVVGYTGNPGQANYSAAKAGVVGFTKSLAMEIATRGITVNCVAPGFIDTDMTRQLTEEQRGAIAEKIPMKKMGKPEEIAAAVQFLASESAGYITGQTLHVNGGMFMT